jgi:hypothetical protein
MPKSKKTTLMMKLKKRQWNKTALMMKKLFQLLLGLVPISKYYSESLLNFMEDLFLLENLRNRRL